MWEEEGSPIHTQLGSTLHQCLPIIYGEGPAVLFQLIQVTPLKNIIKEKNETPLIKHDNVKLLQKLLNPHSISIVITDPYPAVQGPVPVCEPHSE